MMTDREYMNLYYSVGCYLVFELGYEVIQADEIFNSMYNTLRGVDK